VCDVFVSYSSQDEEFALRLRDRIEAAGLRAFVAKVSIEPGQRWTEEVFHALEVAPWVLFVATRTSVRSAYVLQELGAAVVTDKVVVPIVLDLPKSELPGWVDRIQALDLSGVALEAVDAALDALAGRIRADLAERARIGAAAATPREAEALLAQLPLEEVPAPGPLPPGSRVRYPVNPLFVGREEELRWLAGVLKAGGSAAVGQIAAATGYGGIGKTQLAAEFVHRYGRWFAAGVHWLTFADPAGIATEVAACGGPEGMDLPGFESLKPAEQVERVAAAWHGAVPRLLVFDNCEDEELLAWWRPAAGGARVLVTSRRSEWSAGLGMHALRLDVLPRPQSVALLRKHRVDLPEQALDAIADELGDLPLALHLAGHYLARYRHAPFGEPEAYLESLRRQNMLAHPSMTRGDRSPTGHEQHVGRTFALSLARLDPKKPVDHLSLELLARAAWFAPGEPIPRGLLLAAAGIDTRDEDSALRAEDALHRLTDVPPE
jgi:TIR domain